MQKKREICDYRDKLDKTLSSPELTNQDSLKSLLKTQLCSSQVCDEKILDQRTNDVSKLLTKLRSVSMNDHQVSKLTNDASSYSDWKLKHDYEDCRVMYREGLDGSPFHTLLVEGYMDGPIHDCLCVSWESTLYNKWWPQYSFPPFKILETACLQKLGIGEQVCLARMKVPWPLTDREIIIHYFLFEYFKDGLVVILLNTISDLDSIGVSSKDVIPEPQEAVRIDVIGGFVLQKVTTERSYFRVIADVDLKIDFIPPSLINFISRQLIGNGFRLYKKSVASVAKFDEDYSKALANPLYTKICRALYSTDEEPKLETNEDTNENEQENCRGLVTEIVEEEDFEESVSSEDGIVISKNHVGINNRRFCISPEVEQALETLERVIYVVRNMTPVQETEELSPDQVKQVENIEPQKSEEQEFLTSKLTKEKCSFTQQEKREIETGQKLDEMFSDGKKNSSLRRKLKTRCFAFRSWL